MDALIGPLAISRTTIVGQRAKLWIGPVVVLVVALAATLGLWSSYSPNWRQLWTDVVHDRNAHLEYGLGCASDLVHLHFGELVRDIDRSRTWPPLHEGVMVSIAVLLGGIDPRLAALPSLVCYAGAAMLAFLLARRLFHHGGTVAGAVAAALVLVSPAMRAFAVDAMVEGPGAFFTLLGLYVAVCARQEDTPLAWRNLALALSALFFVKYNYWLLVVLALAPLWWQMVVEVTQRLRMLPFRQTIVDQLRQPLNWLVVVLAGAAWWVKSTGRPTPLIVMAMWWAILARCAMWYRLGGRLTLACYPRIESLLHWHALPVALWLAWPGKLASFFWVLWPGTNVGEFPAESRLDGFRYYLDAATTDYHVAVWSIIVVGILIAIGLTAWFARQLRPGSAYVFALVVIAALLTAPHPNRKSRFLHSWLPAVWVLAGVGAGALTRMDRRIAIGVGGLLVAAHLPSLTAAPHAPEGGVQLDRPCALELTDAYLPHLADAQRPAVLCNVPMKFLARWTYLDRYGRAERVLTEVPGFDVRGVSDANATAFQHWLATTKCDVIVLAELPPTSPWYVPVPNHAGLEQLAGLMRGQMTFAQAFRRDFPDRGGAAVSVWRKAPG